MPTCITSSSKPNTPPRFLANKIIPDARAEALLHALFIWRSLCSHPKSPYGRSPAEIFLPVRHCTSAHSPRRHGARFQSHGKLPGSRKIRKGGCYERNSFSKTHYDLRRTNHGYAPEDHPVLSTWGGHIGYSVRPSERGHGYAKEMLRLNLENCRAIGINKVLITCARGNTASEKTILANGGVFESEITVDNEVIRRFWITL